MATRVYNQSARAEATAGTRLQVIAAAQELVVDDENFDPSLEQIANRAGVSTRTVLRHFGSKDGVVEAAIADATSQVLEDRKAEPGNASEAIARIVAHYEESGDHTMRMLAEAGRSQVLERITEAGMRHHREWVESTFAPWLVGLTRRAREDRIARIASLTDVYMWHLLRRRYGLSRQRTETAMRELVETQRGTE